MVAVAIGGPRVAVVGDRQLEFDALDDRSLQLTHLISQLDNLSIAINQLLAQLLNNNIVRIG